MAKKVTKKTVADFGIQEHLQYAEGVEGLLPEVRESIGAAIPEISTLKPSQTEFSLIFGIPKPAPMAHFGEPPGLPTLTTIFSTSIVPSLGNKESYEGWADSLTSLKELASHVIEILVALFRKLSELTEDLLRVTKEKGRYHKG